MIKNDSFIASLMFGDVIEKLVQQQNITESEARSVISKMSFIEYRSLMEASADIVPPSGQKIASAPQKQSQPAATSPKSQPVQQGAAIGQPNNNGQIQVKDPTTGKMEWMAPVQSKPGQPAPQPMGEDKDIARMKKLAGIKETCSSGATGAGSIAVAPVSSGNIKRRQSTYEQPVEYTRTEPAKTIIGDTKPSQASGELSANLAARGKKTASRINNGLRR